LSSSSLLLLSDGEHAGEEKPLACGGGDLPLGGIFVGEQVSLVLASSLRRGGCFKSSRFCGDLFPAIGRCTGGGGIYSRRSWRGSYRWAFNASYAARRCQVTGCFSGFNAFGSLDGSGERNRRSAELLSPSRRHEDRRTPWKKRIFENSSLDLVCLYLFFQGVLCNWGCTQMQISMKSPPFSQKKRKWRNCSNLIWMEHAI
jgi:hypothetical protein